MVLVYVKPWLFPHRYVGGIGMVSDPESLNNRGKIGSFAAVLFFSNFGKIGSFAGPELVPVVMGLGFWGPYGLLGTVHPMGVPDRGTTGDATIRCRSVGLFSGFLHRTAAPPFL